jgi:site-specific DNA-methyltransferase (adenine-specific)
MWDAIEKTGAGVWNIGAGRVAGEPVPINVLEEWSGFGEKIRPKYIQKINTKGRWPANLIGTDGFDLPFDDFFYQMKPTVKEKNAGLNEKNPHPTIKPIDLIRYLSSLILPPGAYAPRRLFVPFSGTGSEMIGCLLAGWDHVTGVEIENKSLQVAKRRLEHYVGE